ncbi:MAG: Transcriptional regulator, TetR family [Labilithrix sp.]|nr:Transcriptional regulator, TetR family [Labilithrix sp.]
MKLRIPKRAGYRKSEDSRRQVLDAALATLAARGLAQTSIQDIADAAGLSKGAVHYHFESKDDLLQHVLERSCENLEARVRAVFESEGTPIERVSRAIREMWQVRRDGTAEIRVLTELHVLARQSAPVKKALGAAFERARRQIVDVGITQLAALGIKPKLSESIVPRLILATLDGLSLQHEVDPVSPAEEEELLQAMVMSVTSLFDM